MSSRPGLAVALGLACLVAARADEAVRRDGTRGRGTLTFAGGRFAFGDQPVAGLDLVRFNPKPVADPNGSLWHQVRLGPGEMFAAEMRSLDATHLHVRLAWAEAVAVPRAAIDRVTQLPGWRPVVFDTFDGELGGWTAAGGPRAAGGRLILDRAAQTVEGKWEGPLAAGRVRVGVPAAATVGRQVVLELPFVRDGKPAPVRVELAGPGERFEVASPARPSHEGLLKRLPGPQRVMVEFDRDRLNIFVGDRVRWAQDVGPGELSAVRLVAEGAGTEAAAVDDVLVARPEPPGQPRAWADLTADAVRSPDGDETFGTLAAAGPRGVTLRARAKAQALGWADVGEFTFRRAAVAERATAGEHVRVRVRSADGMRDVLDGAVTAFDATRLVLAHAVLGDLTIPRDRLEEVRFAFHGRRVPLDSTPRHLGARPAFGFAVPKPDGLRFAKAVTLDPVPADGFVAVDAARVSGTGTPVEVLVNGERVGELNRLADRAEAVVRSYRLPVPAKAWRKETEVEVRLRPAKNGGRVTGVDLRAVRLELVP